MNGLLVGRFQPFHLGHISAIKFALVRSKSLWLCIGSSNTAQSEKNPFSADERQEMIQLSLNDEILAHIKTYTIPDYDDHAKWASAIDATVPDYDIVYTNDEPTSRIFLKKNKDVIPIAYLDRDSLEGSKIRRAIAHGDDLGSLVPDGTQCVLEKIGAKSRLLSFNYK